MKFYMGEENSFVVTSVFKENFSFCTLCKKKETANNVVFPCKHISLCSTCADKKTTKKCPECNEKIEYVVRTIDIYRPII